ncbi:MAG: DUF302 domain-containing protein [Gammaproteobacteria bacterium]
MNRLPTHRTLKLICLGLVLSLASGLAQAQNMLMARTAMSFETTMSSVEKALHEHGYTVAHIQKCDGGLTGMGYETDNYKVIFFGKPEEVRRMTGEYPEMIPFFPQKVVVYAEGDNTVVSTLNPVEFTEFFPQPELYIQFQRWKNDYESILEDIRALDHAASRQAKTSG